MTTVHNLQQGMHVFTCPDGNIHLLSRDPASLSEAEKDAICRGTGTYEFRGFKLETRADGELEAVQQQE